MIGIEKCQMTTMMINEVNAMTPRQNDLVVKNVIFLRLNFSFLVQIHVDFEPFELSTLFS